MASAKGCSTFYKHGRNNLVSKGRVPKKHGGKFDLFRARGGDEFVGVAAAGGHTP